MRLVGEHADLAVEERHVDDAGPLPVRSRASSAAWIAITA